MEALLQDLRYAVRLLVKRPGFTAVVVLALGLGIGANSAIFSVVNALLLRPLPYRASERLVWIWEQNLGNNIKEEPASPPNLADWRNQCTSFDGVTGFSRAGITLTSDAEPEQIPAAAITGDFFSVLGVDPVLGRAFLPEEDTPGNNHVVILSHGIWQRRFGSDPNIIGTSITLNSLPYTVVGVMPPEFRHPRPGDPNAAEMWVPLGLDIAQAPRRGDFL